MLKCWMKEIKTLNITVSRPAISDDIFLFLVLYFEYYPKLIRYESISDRILRSHRETFRERHLFHLVLNDTSFIMVLIEVKSILEVRMCICVLQQLEDSLCWDDGVCS